MSNLTWKGQHHQKCADQRPANRTVVKQIDQSEARQRSVFADQRGATAAQVAGFGAALVRSLPAW
jgi:hypothetical protein